MAPPVKKSKNVSSDNRRLISSTTISKYEHQSMGSFVTSLGTRRSVRVATKMNRPLLPTLKRNICTDVWMGMFPFLSHPELGLKLALVSPRFNVLVDKHFKCNELPIWKAIEIRKDSVSAVPVLFVFTNFNNAEQFPLPDRPLPNKIRFEKLKIGYIDHFVIEFLRSNHQIFDKRGTNLQLKIPPLHNTDAQPIWDIFVREIWPIFAPNIRRLGFWSSDHLDNLRHLISPSILFDFNINTIDSYDLLPNGIGDFDGPNATAGQILSKWLHTPRKDGKPNQLRFKYCTNPLTVHKWIKTYKETFLDATTSVNFIIHFELPDASTPIEKFELVNKRTREKLTLGKGRVFWHTRRWMMKRCQIGQMVKWEDGNLNNVSIELNVSSCIGPLSPKPEEEEAGQSSGKGRRIVRK